jgi:Phage major capsid protein E
MLTLDQFAGEEFQGYVENVPAARNYLLRQYLPNDTVFDLKFAYNVINKQYTRTASITGFNSDAPLRDKDGLSRAFGEVTKVQHGFKIDEEELLRFTNPRRDAEREKAIDYVYDQTDNLVQGIYDLEEWLRAQAIYKGALTYAENGVVIDVDYNIPTENKLVAVNAWSDAALSSPLTDIQKIVDRYKAANNGRVPASIHVSGAVKADLMRSQAVILQVYGDADSRRLVTNDDLNGVLQSLDLPALVIQDMEVDNGDGNERLLPIRRIVALGDREIGKTYIGPTVEKNFEPGIYVMPVIENKPPSQEVYVGETVFPAIKEPNGVVWMDV